jgi:primosomal protein N'
MSIFDGRTKEGKAFNAIIKAPSYIIGLGILGAIILLALGLLNTDTKEDMRRMTTENSESKSKAKVKVREKETDQLAQKKAIEAAKINKDKTDQLARKKAIEAAKINKDKTDQLARKKAIEAAKINKDKTDQLALEKEVEASLTQDRQKAFKTQAQHNFDELDRETQQLNN